MALAGPRTVDAGPTTSSRVHFGFCPGRGRREEPSSQARVVPPALPYQTPTHRPGRRCRRKDRCVEKEMREKCALLHHKAPGSRWLARYLHLVEVHAGAQAPGVEKQVVERGIHLVMRYRAANGVGNK